MTQLEVPGVEMKLQCVDVAQVEGGGGVATVGNDRSGLTAFSALLVSRGIPRGVVRPVVAGRSGLRYLTVYACGGLLTITGKDTGDV